MRFFKTAFLVLVIVFSSFTAYADELAISDWAKEDYEKAAECGFIPDGFGIYDYTESITREKFCELGYSFLRAAVRSKINKVVPSEPFSDTSNEMVLKLSSAGIIAGRGDGVFSPDDFITREEAAAILRRMAVFVGYGLPVPSERQYYTDETAISAWAAEDVKVMYEMGVMNGVNTGEFSPKTSYTAEQAVSTMVRLFEYYETNRLFVDGETKITAKISVKYNSSYVWIENNGEVTHICDTAENVGFKCYFEGENLRAAKLKRDGSTEVWNDTGDKILFVIPVHIDTVTEDYIIVKSDDGYGIYDFEGNEIVSANFTKDELKAKGYSLI